MKDVRRAVSRGERTEDGLVVAEGWHLLDEALRSGCAVERVLATPAAGLRLPAMTAATEVITVATKAFDAVASTESSQGVMALIRPREYSLDQVFAGTGAVVVLDGLQDPGNVGAIARSAEAFAASGIVGLAGTARFDHPKTIRASSGSLFRLPHLGGVPAAELIAECERRGVILFAASMKGPAAHEVDLTRAWAIAIGQEGRGLSEEMARAGSPVSVPTMAVESLNAGVAAGILLYEAHRQRMKAR